MNNSEITRSYVNGFILSTVFTLLAYFVVVNKIFSGWVLVTVVICLAILQLAIQLIYFLHILQESKPRWNLIIVLSTISIILIIIVGSLWIMNNLNYNHILSPTDTVNFILRDEGMGK